MMESFRLQVVQEELSARYNTATYNKMYFFLEGDKIKKDYEELQAKYKAVREEIQKAEALKEEEAKAKFLETLQEQGIDIKNPETLATGNGQKVFQD